MADTVAPIARVERLQAAGPAHLQSALRLLFLASTMAAIVIVWFDWRVGDMAIGTLIGIAVWGPVRYVSETRHSIPHGTLLEAPPGVEVEPPRLGPSGAVWLLGGLALCAPLAWLADRWELGAVFVPGQWAGYAAAELLAAGQIGRWERANGRRVLVDPDAYGDDVRPYAGAKL